MDFESLTIEDDVDEITDIMIKDAAMRNCVDHEQGVRFVRYYSMKRKWDSELDGNQLQELVDEFRSNITYDCETDEMQFTFPDH